MQLPFSDIIALGITSETESILIINVYNPCDKPILSELFNHLREHIHQQNYHIIIMAGDFNCHHPLWNPREYIVHDEEADTLVEMAAELGLNLMIPAGTVTYPNGGTEGTAIDLVWGNDEAVYRLLKCHIAEDHDHGSDHLPIETVLTI